MKKIATAVLILPLLVLSTATPVRAKGVFQLGGVVHSWESNFIQNGSENLFPLSLSWQTPDKRFDVAGSTSFVVGRYEIDAIHGDPAYKYRADRFADSSLKTTLRLPMGSMEGLLMGRLDLPTGDEKWEANQYAGNIPLLFMPTRYRGRGAGGQVIGALAWSTGSWDWAAGGGFSHTGGYEPEPGSADEWQMGDAVLAMASFAYRWGGRATASFGIVQTFPGTTRVAGVDAFGVPPLTRLTHGYRRAFGAESLGWDVGLSLYGKGRRIGVADALVDEPFSSFGTRIDVRPFLVFTVGDNTSLENAFKWKVVLKNDYPVTDPYYEAGGSLWGFEQGLKVNMSPSIVMRYNWAYRYILHEEGALDAEYLPADVTYRSYEFGTKVEYLW